MTYEAALSAFNQGNYAQAIALCEVLLEANTESVKVKLLLAEVYIHFRGQSDRLLPLLFASPTLIDIYKDIVDTYQKQEDWQQAHAYQQKICLFQPDNGLEVKQLNQIRRKLGRSNQKLGFIICGAQKAGTSALAHFLGQHPQIQMHPKKEAHFFSQPRQRFQADYARLHGDFTPNSNVLWAEACPDYLYIQPSIERIWAYSQEIKLIVMLRHPIDRAYSHWQMETARGNESLSFEAALAAEAQRAREVLPFQDRHFAYLDRGLYASQIRQLLRFFSPAQCLFLRTEDLYSKHEKSLEQVFSFLDLPTQPVQDKEITQTFFRGKTGFKLGVREKTESALRQAPISPELRQQLMKRVRGDIYSLEHLLNWDLSDWLAEDTSAD